MTTRPETTSAVSAEEMREIDRKTSEEYGIQSVILMENAGREVALLAKSLNPARTTVVCGSGNNCGDGLVTARYLEGWGLKVDIIFLKDPKFLKGDSLANYNIVKNLSIPSMMFDSSIIFKDYTLIIDALLGTGTKGEVTGSYRQVIEEINKSRARKISVDIPSGLDADSGEVLGIAVKADYTVTMAIPKKGLLEEKARPYTGKLIIADIGIPQRLLRRSAADQEQKQK